MPYFMAAILGGLGGSWCLVTAAAMAIRQQRQPQT
jgi:hypothetical protein